MPRTRLDQSVAEAVRTNQASTIPAAPAGDETADAPFESEAYRYAAGWLADNETISAEIAPFAFVLSRCIALDEDAIRSALPGVVLQRYHGLRSQTVIEVAGRVFWTTENLEKATAITVQGADETQHLFDAISQTGMSQRNIIAFEPRHANLILQRQGLGQGSRRQQVRKPGMQRWTVAQLEEEIEQFHKDQTRTPSAALVPWHQASAGITGEKLEIRISKALAYYLERNWNRGSILAECATQSGRMDVFVTEPVLEGGSGPCVIEIKVLRSHRLRRNARGQRVPAPVPTSEIEWWEKRGIIQAGLYRDEMNAPRAYLCSFDGRDTDTAFPAIIALAAQRDVLLKNYFMYRSSDALIEAELTEATSG